MKFVKGMLIGGIVTAGVAMMYSEAVSKDMEIKNVHLVSKSGGKSGDFVWKE